MDPDITCFYGDPDTTTETTPYASVESALEDYDGVPAVRVRLTFNPDFTDNTYGANSIGWEDAKGGLREFKKITGSDHATLLVRDGNGDETMTVTIDLLSEDLTRPSGWGTLCVEDGDGDIDPSEMEPYILGCQTSISENLNERGYGSYAAGDDPSSPPTTDHCTPSPDAPEWDYVTSFDVWIDASAFGGAGYGESYITEVHASPSKEKDATIVVEPSECPPPTCWPIDPGDCEDSPPPPNEEDTPCEDNADCPGGEFCGVEGTCRVPWPPVE